MKKVFLSGKMTGCPLFNLDAFDNAESDIEELYCDESDGYKIYNPINLALLVFTRDELDDGVVKEGMKERLESLAKLEMDILAQCDIIYMLRGWESSTGATKEWTFASQHGIQIKYQE